MAAHIGEAQKTHPEKASSGAIGSHDRAIVALMLAGFVLGFMVYLFFGRAAWPDASRAVSIGDVQFLREQGEMRFLLSSHEGISNTCRVEVTLSSGGKQAFSSSVEAGILPPYENRTIILQADIPEGRFDYDIEAKCDSVPEE